MAEDFVHPPVTAAAPAIERVGPGVAYALAAVPLAAVVTGLLWKLGFVSAISGLVLAAGATALYIKGAGSPPRRGVAPFVAVIVVGVLVCFMTMIGVDAADFYSSADGAGARAAMSEGAFLERVLTDGGIYVDYARSALMFLFFVALGMFRTLRGALSGS